MKLDVKSLNNLELYIFFVTVALYICILLCSGCTTVIPQNPESSGASYDGGVRNSGFNGWTNLNGISYGIISTNSLARYNALISTYGNTITPAIHQNEGVCFDCVKGLILIEPQALEHFARMNRERLQQAK